MPGKVVGYEDMPDGIILDPSNSNPLGIKSNSRLSTPDPCLVNRFSKYYLNNGISETGVPSANVDDTGYIINGRVKYTANTGMANIATANTNLDGTGTLGTVLTAASNGTLIKTVYIKAAAATTQGMVRLYVSTAAGTARLVAEIEVPATSGSSGLDTVFSSVLDLNFNLGSGDILKASTQNAESFNVIAEGLDWTY